LARALIDRIYEEMQATDRLWSAEELCRTFLHMESSGALAGGLVRSILGQDTRFVEPDPDQWSVTVEVSLTSPVWDQRFRLYWIENRGDVISDWRLHTRLWASGTSADHETWDLAKPDSWMRGRRGEEDVAWVGYQPNLMRRVLVWADRNWASTECEFESIDLSHWCAVSWLDENAGEKPENADLQLPRLAHRWGLGPLEESPGGCLRLLAALLERLRERYPDSTQDALSDSYGEAMEPRPVDWTRLGFGSEALGEVPEGPGIYRFWSETGELLYLGKSSDLPRRIRSYFQNLPTAPSRREELIYQIERIECESAGSEIEALLRESQAIRREGPRFNIQIDIHPPQRFPKNWQWPLVYVPNSADSTTLTIVGLSGPDRGGLIRVEEEDLIKEIPVSGESSVSGSGERGRLRQWCADLLGLSDLGSLDSEQLPAPSVSPQERGPISLRESEGSLAFDPADSWLALRYYSRRHDRLDRIDPLAIHDPETLFDLLVGLASSESEGTARLVREST